MNQNQNNMLETVDLIKDTFEKTDFPKLTWTTNYYNDYYGWLKLENVADLTNVMVVLQNLQARLCTISAYTEDRSIEAKRRAIAYHFAIKGVLFCVTVRIYDKETLEPLPVPSITPYFRNADWHEREFREMYNIEVLNHPNPKRLFLDESLDAGIMAKLIPFSSLVHGTGSKDLWEHVMLEKIGFVPETFKNECNEQPHFTKVEETKQETPKPQTEDKE